MGSAKRYREKLLLVNLQTCGCCSICRWGGENAAVIARALRSRWAPTASTGRGRVAADGTTVNEIFKEADVDIAPKGVFRMSLGDENEHYKGDFLQRSWCVLVV